jgi:tetratricopeptide (TPR) repeat protein
MSKLKDKKELAILILSRKAYVCVCMQYQQLKTFVKKKNILLVCLIIICLSTMAIGQNAKIDELKLRLKNAKHDTTRVITLYKLAVHSNYIGEYKEALLYANQSIKLGEKIHFSSGCAGAYNNAGVTYFFLGKYPEALNHYHKALKYSKEALNKNVIAQSTMNVGIVYAVQKNYNKAFQYFKRAEKVLQEIDDKQALIDLYSNMGSLYYEEGNYKEALKYDFLAIKLYEETGIIQQKLVVLNNMADIYIKEGNFIEAFKFANEALQCGQITEDKNGIATTFILMGEIYFQQNNLSKANHYYNDALKIAQEIGSLKLLSDVYQKLSLLFASQNNDKAAFYNYKKYIIYRDSIFSQENTQQLVQLQMQYSFDEKESLAKAKQQIKDARANEEIQKQRLLKTAIGAGAALVLLIFLLLTNRRKAKYELQVNKLENKTLRSQLNPHFIFNALASIQKYMNEHPELAENYLAKFGKLMREVLEYSEKDYITLEEEFAMLKNYMDLEKLRISNGFDYEFINDENIDVEEIQIPPLLLQPIIENAIWHGVANGNSKGSILISTDLKDDILLIEIENKNEGYTANGKTSEENIAKRKSFGLQIVKERLALLSKEKSKSSKIEMTATKQGMKVKILIPF